MSKDQYAILTGAICNVSIDTSDVASVLFRETDSSGLVMVSPGTIHSASLYFKKKKKNLLFHDMIIEVIYLPNDVNLNLTDKVNEKIPICADTQEKQENPLDVYRFNLE